MKQFFYSLRRPSAPTYFCGFSVAFLAILPILVGNPPEHGLPDIVKFIGRFHPVFLHLPIGMLSWLLISETLHVFSKKSSTSTNTAAFYATAISAVIAALLGFILYYSMPDYDQHLAQRHLIGGLTFACFSIITLWVKIWTDRHQSRPVFYRCFLLLSACIMGFTSHDGASLTHGTEYLTEYAPAPIRTLMGSSHSANNTNTNTPSDPNQQVVYTHIITPIFQQKCYSCHNAEKQKGKYRMDDYEQLLAGGEEKNGIVPNQSIQSNLVKRIELDPNDDEHMPPKGKKDLSTQEVALIKWWIDQGASKTATVSSLKSNDEITKIISTLVSPQKKADDLAAKQQQEQAAIKQQALLRPEVDRLRVAFPAALHFESQHSNHLIFTAVGLRKKFNDQEFAKLETLMPAFVSIDLSATSVTDASGKYLSKASNLKSLRLGETDITDKIIDDLISLKHLESLNLYQTKITQSGCVKLGTMSQLKKLYLWQTQMNETALKELKTKLPNCEMVTGQ